MSDAITKKHRKLKGFSDHGVTFTDETDTQAIGKCPFCGKSKFYAHRDDLVWDCKVCGEHGNFAQFLDKRAREYARRPAPSAMRALAENRGLSTSTFVDWGVGWSGAFYSIPARGNAHGRTMDIRRYRLGTVHGSMATTGGKMCLIAPLKNPESDEAWICEGEWDGMALWESLKKAGRPAMVYAVPGATNFTKDSVALFVGKNVIIPFDADDAGARGARKVGAYLQGVAKSVRYVQWPEDVPEGYDVRDLYKSCGRKGRKTLAALEELLTSKPPMVQDEGGAAAEDAESAIKQSELTGKGLTKDEVVKRYRKWLHIDNPEVFSIVYGMAFANRLDAEPLWIFLVSPPGGMKSEICMSLADAPLMHVMTTLTPHALISGMNHGAAPDPSLIPRLDGKILVVKDFTTILDMNQLARDEIFAILRDAYDGEISKSFGNGVTRTYRSRFGILAGVTQSIESRNKTVAVGERFLKYRMQENNKLDYGTEPIGRAIRNVATSTSTSRKKALREIAKEALDRPILEEDIPEMRDSMVDKVTVLAQWVANLRGVVDRDRYTNRVNYKPVREVGTRLGVQLYRLAMGIAMFHREKEISDETYRIIAKVARDTAPDMVEEIVRHMFVRGAVDDKYYGTAEVSGWVKFPRMTVKHILEDLVMLKIAETNRKGMAEEWRLTPAMRRQIEELEIYSDAVAWQSAKKRSRSRSRPHALPAPPSPARKRRAAK